MRLTNYLITEGRKVDISDEKFFTLLQINCSNAVKYNKQPIYRGMTGFSNCFYIRGLDSKDERKSPNAYENIYNLLFSNLPSWSKYPKRNMSIICSTSKGTADGYGSLYCIFPYNKTKIGIVPNYDIWETFGRYGYTRNLNYYIVKIFQKFLNIDSENIYTNYNELLKYFDDIDEIRDIKRDILMNFIADNVNIDFFMMLNQLKYFNSKKKFINCLNTSFDPDVNGFDLITSKEKYPTNCEVWLDDSCLAVREDVYNSNDFQTYYNELKLNL